LPTALPQLRRRGRAQQLQQAVLWKPLVLVQGQLSAAVSELAPAAPPALLAQRL
jgi:hypothetical protein